MNLCQLSGFILYVEAVTCFTPMFASVLIRFSGLSFKYGIIGSMRTDVGTPFLISVSTVFKRSDVVGAWGSMLFAMLSSSVVIVKDTVEGIFFKRAMSLTIRLDFVIIWILQLCWDRISKHFRIKPVLASMLGYGSEELEIDIISPFSWVASLSNFGIKSFFGLQLENFGM